MTMKTILLTILMLFFITVSYGRKKDRKPKNETVRVYKNKDWKIKKELNFTTPKQIKLT